jgi:hypothetical protein
MSNYSEIMQWTSIKLSDLLKPLESISVDTEPEFIKLGNNLRSIFSRAEDVASLTADAAGLINGRSDASALSDIGEISRLSLKKLDSCTDEVSKALSHLSSCFEYLKKLNDRYPIIIRVAKTLNMVALNISMESSRNETSDDTFNIFVNEIKSLAYKVSDIARKIKEDSQQAGKNQKKDFDSILSRRNQLSIIAGKARETVSANMSRIETLLERSLQILHQSEIRSRKISGLVGDVVASIQFHDITRQQIEHIMHAFVDISNIDDEISDSENPSRESDRFEKAYSIINLQISQLAQVVVEVGEADKKITRAFEKIGQEIDALVEGLGSLEKDSNCGEEGQGGFNFLLSGLEKLNNVTTQGEALMNEIFQKIHSSSASASSISGYLGLMEDIGMELHIKAINALIMSRKLGQTGITISILAKDVRNISKGSNDFVSEVIDILQSIEGLGRELTGAGSDNVERLECRNIKAMSLAEGIIKISNIHAGFLEISSGCQDRAASLKNELSKVNSDLQFIKSMESSLEERLISIRKIAERLSPLSKNRIARALDPEKEGKRYTMQVEREIHKRVAGIASAQRASTPKNLPGQGKNEFGENVKLF